MKKNKFKRNKRKDEQRSDNFSSKFTDPRNISSKVNRLINSFEKVEYLLHK